MFTPGPCALFNAQWTMDVSAKHLLSAESQTAICYLLAIGYVLYLYIIHLKNNINIIIIKIEKMLWDRIRYKVDNELLSNFSKFSHCAVPRLVLLTTDVYKDDSGNSDVIIQP